MALTSRKFRLLPERARSSRVRSLGVRLAVGKWEEHKEAAEFIDEVVTAHGELVDTVVRALLLYRDHVREQEADAQLAEEEQMRLLVADEVRRQLTTPSARA